MPMVMALFEDPHPNGQGSPGSSRMTIDIASESKTRPCTHFYHDGSPRKGGSRESCLKNAQPTPAELLENSTAFEKNLKSIFFRNKRRDGYFHPLLL
jgi:hypothetical protein